MRIGIDFDNTIARYDDVFPAVAVKEGILPSGKVGSKREVRDTLRAEGPEGELRWQRLQGMVYGKHMHRAAMFEGLDLFLETCRTRAIPVCIVSHKTETGHHDPERINLRDAAWAWMRQRKFFQTDGYAISEDNVFFESTRDDKIARIAQLGLSHFIDDLEEVFSDPSFPDGIARILFAPGWAGADGSSFRVARSWRDVHETVFNDAAI